MSEITTPTELMDIDDVLNIFREGMPKLNGIQQEAIDQAIWYLEHHQMD